MATEPQTIRKPRRVKPITGTARLNLSNNVVA